MLTIPVWPMGSSKNCASKQLFQRRADVVIWSLAHCILLLVLPFLAPNVSYGLLNGEDNNPGRHGGRETEALLFTIARFRPAQQANISRCINITVIMEQNRLVGRARSSLEREAWSSNLWLVKSNAVLSMDRHRCDVSSKEAVMPGCNNQARRHGGHSGPCPQITACSPKRGLCPKRK